MENYYSKLLLQNYHVLFSNYVIGFEIGHRRSILNEKEREFSQMSREDCFLRIGPTKEENEIPSEQKNKNFKVGKTVDELFYRVLIFR